MTIKTLEYYKTLIGTDQDGALVINTSFINELKDISGRRIKDLVTLIWEPKIDRNYIELLERFQTGKKKNRNGFGEKTITAVFNKTGGRCFYCGVTLPPDTDLLDEGGKPVVTKRNWHIDHVYPFSRGGSDDLDNLVPSCVKCNLQKRARLP